MGCLEGWSARLQCRNSNCGKVWDGSQLILGTMYSYDIFAAVPCCADRLKVNISICVWNIFGDTCFCSATPVDSSSFTRNRDSTSSLTTVRQFPVHNAEFRTSTLSSLWSTRSWPRKTSQDSRPWTPRVSHHHITASMVWLHSSAGQELLRTRSLGEDFPPKR